MDMEFEDGHSPVIFFCLFATVILALLLSAKRKEPNLKCIPTFGHATYFLSYCDAFKFMKTGRDHVQNGYEKYRGAVFKISTLNRWLVILTGERMVEELRKVSENEISFTGAVDEPDSSLYASGHFKSVLSRNLELSTRYITQNIGCIVPVVCEEIISTFDHFIPSNTIDWHQLNAMSLVTETTARAVNRVFVGHFFSQDQEYSRLTASLALDAYQWRLPAALTVLPATFQSILQFFSKRHQRHRRLQLLTESFIHRRRQESEKYKDEKHKDADLLSSLVTISATEGTLPDIANSLSELIVTTNRTISLTYSHALYHLASNPKYAGALRKEVRSTVSEEGWSRVSLDKMRKIDSFLKESMRMSNISSVSSFRKVIQPYTFADGTRLPEGTLLATAAQARHFDDNIYTSADIFDGFRYFDMHNQRYGDDPGMQFQLVSTSAKFLAWGYGRHACSGRFFAAAVMKMMLAHTVLHYDVRFEDGVRPKDIVIGTNYLPDPNAKILFRRRRA